MISSYARPTDHHNLFFLKSLPTCFLHTATQCFNIALTPQPPLSTGPAHGGTQFEMYDPELDADDGAFQPMQ